MALLPNFLIIGAPKCGTSALYFCLEQHPEIYMSPIKEPDFFAFENDPPTYRTPFGNEARANKRAIVTLREYVALFDDVRSEKAVGEASTIYLYHPSAPKRIHAYIPDARLVAILRNPIERAYSSFLHQIREGLEPLEDFEQALLAEEERLAKNFGVLWRYVDVGLYSQQLERYYSVFDRSQIRIYLYEDFSETPEKMLIDLFQYLGVDPTFCPRRGRFNVTGVPRSRILQSLIDQVAGNFPLKSLIPRRPRRRASWFVRGLNLRKPDMSEDARRYLNDVFRDEILKLQGMLSRDLSRWLE